APSAIESERVHSHPLRSALMNFLNHCEAAPSRRRGSENLAWLKGNAHEKSVQAIPGRHIRRISAMEPQHRAFRVMGDKHARDDTSTAKTTNRCGILGTLPHRHRRRRNRYIGSSKARTNPAVTVVRGAPALAVAAAPGHRLKVNIISVK